MYESPFFLFRTFLSKKKRRRRACEEMVGRLAPEPITSAYIGKVVFALKRHMPREHHGAYALLGHFSASGVRLDVR